MKSIIAYGSFLALSLGLAYMRWTKPPNSLSDDEIVVMYGETKDIEKIVWETEKDKLEMTVENDEQGVFIWATHTQKPKKEGDEPKVKSFKAGEKGDKILTALSPLGAKRKFESLSDEKIAEIGLDVPPNKLVITRKGKEQTLELSEQLYSSFYAKDENGVTFLLDAKKLKDLKSARTTLPDKRLWSFKKNELTGMSVLLPSDISIDIVHENWQDKPNAEWKLKGLEAVEQDKQLVTWVGKISRLSVKSYADDDLNADELALKMTLTVTKEGEKSQVVEILSDASDENWYGRSVHTRKLVELRKQSIQPLVEEAPALVAAE